MLALSAKEVALARSRAYTFFSQIYRRGVVQEQLPILQSIPELAETLDEPFDAEQAAADHHDLFGFNVFPYESTFLDASGMLGGEISAAALRAYRQVGLEPADSVVPEHVGGELGWLAFICGAEADAWESDQTERARHARYLQRSFLEAHFLRWIAPLVLAIRAEQHPFYCSLADLTLELAAAHYLDLGEMDSAMPAFDLQPPAPLLQDERAGLKEIAAYLASPMNSGIFLSRSGIARLARQARLPRGFGGRTQILTNLLRSAAQYEQFLDLVERLEATVQTWHAGYHQQTEAFPYLAPFIHPWLRSVAETARMLAQLREQIPPDADGG